MTENTPPPIAPRRRIWLRVLLFVSLAMNLAVVGIVAGAYLSRVDDKERPERIARELGLGPFLMALDADNREALYASAKARRGELVEGRAAWGTAFRETLTLIRQEPFDEARFLDLVERQAQIASRGRSIGQEELAVQLARMSPQERAAFADKLERGMRFAERFRDKRHGGVPLGPDRPARPYNDGPKQD
ncbi:periplasmic heavy metal sensor [Tropicimonas marinistellae]|uniref:periplasmic heavy metal sensor n=1 Tax=Tropicimonas marinistellae TaxID=1739787 RepID=UPI0008359F7E|nr:periplasmic heavy metal sensor [Tropicimonas marinistellae]